MMMTINHIWRARTAQRCWHQIRAWLMKEALIRRFRRMLLMNDRRRHESGRRLRLCRIKVHRLIVCAIHWEVNVRFRLLIAARRWWDWGRWWVRRGPFVLSQRRRRTLRGDLRLQQPGIVVIKTIVTMNTWIWIDGRLGRILSRHDARMMILWVGTVCWWCLMMVMMTSL